MAVGEPYLLRGEDARGDGTRYVPEASRRARGFVLHATLRALGRNGVAAIVERCCAHARRFAELLAAAAASRSSTTWSSTKRWCAFPATPPEAGDGRTRAMIEAVQRDGTCWVGGTTWNGRAAMRISMVNWSTADCDIERSAAAILRAADASLR